MKRLFILLILIISILSLLIVFPNIVNTSNTAKNEEINAIYQDIGYAENLCTALCTKYSEYNLTGACISDEDTITGQYWIYPNISCYVKSEENPCVNKGIVEIELFENCSVEKVSFVNEK